MNLIVGFVILFLLSWRLGDWSEFHKYYPAMLFVSIWSLLFTYLTMDYRLWEFQDPGEMISHQTSGLIVGTGLIPLIIFIYLSLHSEYPVCSKGWAGLVLGGVILLTWLGAMKFSYGWNLIYMLGMTGCLFPLVHLFQRKPAAAWLAGVAGSLLLIMALKIPVWSMK